MRRKTRRLAGRLRLWLFMLVNELIRWLVPHRPTQAVLVIRLDAIGDFLLWLAAGAADTAQLARERGRSVLLAKRDWAAFAEALGLFDEVWPVDTERLKFDPLYRFRLQVRLRRHGFGLVIQPRAAREFLLEDSMIRVCGAAEVIGSLGNGRNIESWLKRIGDRWHTRLIAVPDESAHEMERTRAFSRGLTGKEPRGVALEFEAGVPQGFGLHSPYFVVAPGAGWSGRCWPADRFGQIAARLRRETGLDCVILGGAGDRELAATIVEALQGQCVNLVGATSLLQTGALLKSARLAIVNESGLSHYAACVGTTAVVLLGGGHFGWFMPYLPDAPVARLPSPIYRKMDCYGCDWKCKFDVPAGAAVPCISCISTEEVWDGIQTSLGLSASAGVAVSLTDTSIKSRIT